MELLQFSDRPDIDRDRFMRAQAFNYIIATDDLDLADRGGHAALPRELQAEMLIRSDMRDAPGFRGATRSCRPTSPS
jgi:hypothetical protein